jgi:serine/threonine protein phosphatase PrpC
VFTSAVHDPGDDPRAQLSGTTARLVDAARSDARMSSMSTTLVPVLICSATVTLLNVGDSEAYLVRGAAARRSTVRSR